VAEAAVVVVVVVVPEAEAAEAAEVVAAEAEVEAAEVVAAEVAAFRAMGPGMGCARCSYSIQRPPRSLTRSQERSRLWP
jgi:hypothetical protein